MAGKLYIIYDERAMYDEDKAMVLDTADTEKEAHIAAEAFAPCVIFQYTKNGRILENGQLLEYVG